MPLLAGESVTSDIRVENGNVLLNMAPDQKNFRWFSSFRSDQWKWFRWEWECFSVSGLWRKIDWNKLRNRPWKKHGDRQKKAETEGGIGMQGCRGGRWEG